MLIRLLLLAVLLSGSVLAGCTGSQSPAVPAATSSPAAPAAKSAATGNWDRLLADARKEATVMVYTTSPGIREGITPSLKDRFGLSADFMVAKGDEMTQKVMTESQRGLNLVDVHVSGTMMVTSYKDAGLLAPLPESLLLPEVKDPAAWPNGQMPFVDKEKSIIPLTGAYWSYLLVNTDMVKEGEIKSYKNLLAPKWKGKMVMFDPSLSGAASNWMIFVPLAMGAGEGVTFLRQLADQDLVMTRDSRLQGEWVARGKYPVAIAPSMGVVTPLLQAGTPISWVRVSEGGLVHPSGSLIGINPKAPHPAAARVLLNWLLTAEGQAIFSKGFGQPPMRLGVPAQAIDPFTIPRPGEKVFLADEKFMIDAETKGKEVGKEIFGHLLK